MQNESIEAQRLAAEGAEVSDELVKVPLAPGSAGKPKKKPFRQRFKKEILAYSLIGIPLVWWCVFFVVALVWAFCTSFTDMRGGYGFDLSTTFRLIITSTSLRQGRRRRKRSGTV